DAGPPGCGVLPGKEGQHRSRMPHFVAVIEMIGARIVEVHRFLDEAQAEHAGVERKVAIGASANGGDVVNGGHDVSRSGWRGWSRYGLVEPKHNRWTADAWRRVN